MIMVPYILFLRKRMGGRIYRASPKASVLESAYPDEGRTNQTRSVPSRASPQNLLGWNLSSDRQTSSAISLLHSLDVIAFSAIQQWPPAAGLEHFLFPIRNKRYSSPLLNCVVWRTHRPISLQGVRRRLMRGNRCLSTWPLVLRESRFGELAKTLSRVFRSEPQKHFRAMEMDDLTYTLRQLCQRNRDGSHATQADRKQVLCLASRQLREAGFRQMRAGSLKSKHIEALLNRWQAEGLSTGTLKNRLSHLRWWAEKVDKGGVIPADNTLLGIPRRRLVTNQNKAKQLGNGLERVNDPHARMSLSLQQAFGLRREESIKFQPSYADCGHCIVLKSSWAKGGRARKVPVTTPEQRTVLNQAHRLAGMGSLIPPHKTYIQQRHTYDGECKAAGLSHMHGLRHHYAQARYEALTGWKAPSAGGRPTRMLTDAERAQDMSARETISHELGHERIEITAVYLGR